MKKKLTLDLDALVVDTFDATAAERARGTVRGNDDQTGDWTCYTCMSICPDPVYGSACVEPSCIEVC